MKINANGLRGPLIPYARDESSLRILYLGDSVTFGYKLPGHEQSFPFRTEPLLEERFGVNVETINAGVGGCSPWQELAYLRKEGIRDLMRDDRSERVEEAWRITLENLDGIFDFCRQRDIPIALLLFPDLSQFNDVAGLGQPQRILVAHAGGQGVPVLDLLQPMADVARKSRRRPQQLFIDHDHLTAWGSEVVAHLLRDFLARHCRDLLPDHCRD